MGSTPRLIVGLGNPGPKYVKTRHNVGRDFIDYLAEQTQSKIHQSRHAEWFRLPAFFLDLSEKPPLCVKLLCYINESGPALKNLYQSEGIKPEEILVVTDDFAIPFGTLRLRPQGSSGGHNGLQSIIEATGSQNFGRIRIGVGPLPAGHDAADFVLSRFSKEEWNRLPDLFIIVKEGMEILFKDGYEKAMAKVNKKHW